MIAFPHGFVCPEYRYVPGRNARPSCSLIQDVAARAAAASGLGDPKVRYAWSYGRYLIGEAFFWEAHEVLEPVWMQAPPNSRERLLVQGFIQLANACLKVEMGRPHAARRLGVMACDLMQEATRFATGPVLGADPGDCLKSCRRLVDAIAAGDDWRRILNDFSCLNEALHNNAS